MAGLRRPIRDGVVDPQRQAAFAAEGLRRRAAMGIAPRNTGGMMNVAPSMPNASTPMPQMPMQSQGVQGPRLHSWQPLASPQGMPANAADPEYINSLHRQASQMPLGNPAPQYSSPQPSASPTVTMGQAFPSPLNTSDLSRPAGTVARFPAQGLSRMQQFDMRQAQQNAMGQLQASRSTNFNMPQFPFGPQNLPPQLQRADAALNGQFGGNIPLEQQSFARSQGFGPMGQQMGGFPQMGQQQMAPAPQDQYGLQRALGTGNIQPSPGAMPAGENSQLGRLGQSSVYRINGRNVVVGDQSRATPESLAQPGGVSNAISSALRAPAYQAQVQANAARMQKRTAPMQARQSALRASADQKRFGKGYKAPEVAASPQIPLPPVPTGKADKDKMAQDSARAASLAALNKVGNANGLFDAIPSLKGADNFAKHSAHNILRGIDSPEFSTFTPEGVNAMRSAVGHYLNVHGKGSFGLPSQYDELHAFASGDTKTRDKLRKARSENAARIHRVQDMMPR